MLGESAETIICRIKGDVTDPAASEYLMTWYVTETSGYQPTGCGRRREREETRTS